jgi:hypothetical protein
MTRCFRPLLALTVAAAAVLIARPALAGPPLLCFPFEIGNALSLPMGKGDWKTVDRKYDVTRLVDDTLALLAPATPVTVRMETIRRATIYASAHPKPAAALLAALEARAKKPEPSVAALAVFDFGYLVETYKQAKFMFSESLPAIDRIDGYQLVLKAHALQSDQTMQHAANLIVGGQPKGHAAK